MQEFVPYQADIGQAFEGMVRKLFAENGESYPFELPSPQSEEEAEEFESFYEELGCDPVRFAGTMLVRNERGISAMCPLTEQESIGLFGSNHPSREQIENSEISDLVGRGEGVYCIAFHDGKPCEICFVWATVD
jgi:hypothetical protein